MKHFRTPFNSFGANEDTEKRLIFKALNHYKRPLTRRFLNEVTGLELPTLCRALYNLTYKYKSLRVAEIKRCPKTGKKVFHYYFETPKPNLFTKSSND